MITICLSLNCVDFMSVILLKLFTEIINFAITQYLEEGHIEQIIFIRGRDIL